MKAASLFHLSIYFNTYMCAKERNVVTNRKTYHANGIADGRTLNGVLERDWKHVIGTVTQKDIDDILRAHAESEHPEFKKMLEARVAEKRQQRDFVHGAQSVQLNYQVPLQDSMAFIPITLDYNREVVSDRQPENHFYETKSRVQISVSDRRSNSADFSYQAFMKFLQTPKAQDLSSSEFLTTLKNLTRDTGRDSTIWDSAIEHLSR